MVGDHPICVEGITSVLSPHEDARRQISVTCGVLSWRASMVVNEEHQSHRFEEAEAKVHWPILD